MIDKTRRGSPSRQAARPTPLIFIMGVVTTALGIAAAFLPVIHRQPRGGLIWLAVVSEP